MTAPLPIRFYNPVKDLCKKANLDYETVIGLAVSPVMREAYLNAEIKKPLDQIKSEDKKFVKHKKDFFDRKYGSVFTSGTDEGESKDKGRDRYDKGAIVEYPLPDDSKSNESTAVSNSVAFSKSSRSRSVWIPGKGVQIV
jgi:hypothetical protein